VAGRPLLRAAFLCRKRQSHKVAERCRQGARGCLPRVRYAKALPSFSAHHTCGCGGGRRPLRAVRAAPRLPPPTRAKCRGVQSAVARGRGTGAIIPPRQAFPSAIGLERGGSAAYRSRPRQPAPPRPFSPLSAPPRGAGCAACGPRFFPPSAPLGVVLLVLRWFWVAFSPFSPRSFSPLGKRSARCIAAGPAGPHGLRPRLPRGFFAFALRLLIVAHRQGCPSATGLALLRSTFFSAKA
jgi:hypothetical protein